MNYMKTFSPKLASASFQLYFSVQTGSLVSVHLPPFVKLFSLLATTPSKNRVIIKMQKQSLQTQWVSLHCTRGSQLKVHIIMNQFRLHDYMLFNERRAQGCAGVIWHILPVLAQVLPGTQASSQNKYMYVINNLFLWHFFRFTSQEVDLQMPKMRT